MIWLWIIGILIIIVIIVFVLKNKKKQPSFEQSVPPLIERPQYTPSPLVMESKFPLVGNFTPIPSQMPLSSRPPSAQPSKRPTSTPSSKPSSPLPTPSPKTPSQSTTPTTPTTPTSPSPTPSPKTQSQSTTSTTPSPSPTTPTTPLPWTLYSDNNGTVSGTTYCQGVWKSPTNTNKKMVCVYGIDSKGNTIPCNSGGVAGGNNSFYCASPNYSGNNGSVNGNTYCQGIWGSPTNTNKNLICVGGIDSNGNSISCASGGIAGGNNSFFCSNTPPFYSGNNGSVSGTVYCQGSWGNPTNTDKNKKCVYGIDANGNTIDCSSGGVVGKNNSFLCV